MRYLLLLLALAVPTLTAQVQARPAITGLAFARFYEADPTAATRFYTGELGLRSVSGLDGNTDYAVNAQQWIETVPHVGPDAQDRLAAVGFTTRNAATLQKYLAAKGYPAVEPLRNGQFAVHDPEGRLIYFVQEGSNRAVTTSEALPNAASRRMIHAGFIVNSAEKENAFYREVLGFKPYWHGGHDDSSTDYVSQQVPDGVDWLEYMLNVKPGGDLKAHGGPNHVSLGTAQMDTVVAALKANGCTDGSCEKTLLGRDGKMQLNLFDPDHTRIEFMEYNPRRQPCCSPLMGMNPTDVEVK